ncbi:hypothetical protein FRC09_009059, partial [Ceratobasidium sp. 395]
MLAETKPKHLLGEFRDVSESEGYESSHWENEVDDLDTIKSGMGKTPIEVWKTTETSRDESPQAGPSYFDKGKWVKDTDYEANMTYKTSAQPKTYAQIANPLKQAPRRARPSLGIRIDDVRPAQPPKTPKAQSRDTDLNASIAALPGGGYFADKMRAKSVGLDQSGNKSLRFRLNPPSSSDSSSSSSSDSSSESDDSDSPDNSGNSSDSSSSSSSSGGKKRKSPSRKRHDEKRRARHREKTAKLKKQLRKARRASIKLKEPTPYNGEQDYDKFELWDYETEQWLKESGLKKKKAVRYVGTFLKGKAAQWYMDFVAPDPSAHTLDTIKIGLFSYCFPPDLKAQLQREFKQARQGELKFIDYMRQLRRLQRRIPDITDRQICVKLWDTVQAYLKIKWIEAGIDAESADLEIMRESAERFEAAEEVRQRARAAETAPAKISFRQNAKYPVYKNPPYQSPRPQYTPNAGHASSSQQQQSKPNYASKNPPGPPKPQNRQRNQKPRQGSSKMSREERNELRAANKCFSCKEVGHTVKDCPSRTTAKPSGTYIAALKPAYDLIEQLRKEREMAEIPVASIQPVTAQDDTETEDETTDDSITSYGTLDVDVSHAGSLLTEILEEITQYSDVVVTDTDRFRITTKDMISFDMTYAEIAQQVRDTYLAIEEERKRVDNENNQTLPPIPEEGNLTVRTNVESDDAWSDSDDETVRTDTIRGMEKILEDNAVWDMENTPKEHWPLHTQLYALRLGENKRTQPSPRHAESSTARQPVVERGTTRPIPATRNTARPTTVERNAARPKDITRKLPKPIVVETTINGHKVRALIDTGSLGDFISTTVVDQLKLERQTLAKPIGLQMAVTGSRSTINDSVTARLGYQGIDEMRRFDVINLDNYDLILGTPFLYQYKVIVSFNPPTVSIGERDAQPIQRESLLVIESLAARLYDSEIEKRREALR